VNPDTTPEPNVDPAELSEGVLDDVSGGSMGTITINGDFPLPSA
jgi:hypothetical protein